MSLEDTTSELGKVHKKWKEAEVEKDKLRKQFFNEITEEVASEVAAQSVEVVEAKDEEETLRVSQRRFPRHRVIDVRQRADGNWDVVLEENPELRPYVFVNPEDGQVYQRSVAQGSPYLDDDAIRQENPELWQRITVEKTRRELQPLEDLPPEDLEAIAPYLTLPRPQVRFPNPRRAKPEELSEDDDGR